MAESDSVATSTIAVHRGAWESVCPNLPAELAAMVAPPVTVSALPVAGPYGDAQQRRRAREARFRGNMPSGPAYRQPRRAT
ncbi:hypothetical protein Asp14428_31230 [Actinoplanes sp. NBRC 14428]|uniref:Uncharacterized protein n=1 Tax=Pseudosporangium ferrugineum TaxID=439699 RepID=A0A2T0RFL8_9ACTN|nr:hypothetical protein [Pseudosporangium ferrugineum]PRY20004.1 hypothetical protein CLV70_12642 [Pseudosporangium ferrugineum]BCJ51648.1 hypothetical protein Asp14428_31230 [Actinoplanes sp. NBRC 14428]